MGTQTQRDSSTDTAIIRLPLHLARAEADAIRAFSSGFPIDLRREKNSVATDPILAPTDIEALRWVAKFGWVRWWMLARLMWSASPPESARTLAMRMIRGLTEKHLIYPVIGGDGHDVFLLAERGAAYLRTHFPGLYARDMSVGRRGLTAGTRQTSPAGATFIHRLIANAYLCDTAASGRLVATEYEQLVDAEEWRTSWRQVGYRAKRCDGLIATAGPMYFGKGAALLDIEVIETVRTRPGVSSERNAAGIPVVQDEMGRLLVSLRQHSANGQRVTLLLVDERAGHGLAKTIIRYAALRGIHVSPELVQFVFVTVRPGSPILGPFRHTPWPRGTHVAVAPTAPRAIPTRAVPVSSGTTESPANPAPSLDAGNAAWLEGPARTARRPEFRLVRDKRLANGEREIIIQHVTTGISAQTSTGGTNTSAYMAFAFFDPDDQPLYLDPVVRPDILDLTDPVEFEELCHELRQHIRDAGLDE